MQHSFVWLIWDLVAALVFVIVIRICARRGFVSTLMHFAGYFIAAAVAIALKSAVAKFVYDRFVYDALLKTLTTRLNETIGGTSTEIIGAMPGFLKILLAASASQVAAISPAQSAESMARSIIDVGLQQPLMTLLTAASFLLLFTITAFVVRLLARVFTGVNRIPVVGTLNTILGGIIGIFVAAVVLYIAAFIIKLVIVLSGGNSGWLSDDVLQSTYIWNVFY